MKKIIFLFVLILSAPRLQAQEEYPEPLYVEEEALFNKGKGDLSEYILNNIRFPDSLIVDGRVLAQFVVETNGSVSHIEIIESIQNCPACSQEVIRLISEMPPWKPGRFKGEAVRTRLRLPVKFSTK